MPINWSGLLEIRCCGNWAGCFQHMPYLVSDHVRLSDEANAGGHSVAKGTRHGQPRGSLAGQEDALGPHWLALAAVVPNTALQWVQEVSRLCCPSANYGIPAATPCGAAAMGSAATLHCSLLLLLPLRVHTCLLMVVYAHFTAPHISPMSHRAAIMQQYTAADSAHLAGIDALGL